MNILEDNPQFRHLFAPTDTAFLQWRKADEDSVVSACKRYEICRISLGHAQLFDVFALDGTNRRSLIRGLSDAQKARNFCERQAATLPPRKS